MFSKENHSKETYKGGGDSRQRDRWQDESERKKDKWRRRKKKKNDGMEGIRKRRRKTKGYKEKEWWKRCRDFTKKIFKRDEEEGRKRKKP